MPGVAETSFATCLGMPSHETSWSSRRLPENNERFADVADVTVAVTWRDHR